MTAPWISQLAALGLEGWILGLESLAVIGLRSARLSAFDAAAGREAQLMVHEKIVAALDLQADMVAGRLGSDPIGVSRAVVRHYGRRVRANHRRLAAA